MKKIAGLAIALSLLLVSCNTSPRPDLGDGIFAQIDTDKGTMIAKLEYEMTPVTVANFVSLADGTNSYVNEELKGKHFYDSILFHRVIPDFMIQTGDPQGTGMGGPGYRFKDEFTDLSHSEKGILSMANAGSNTNGSQIFITHVPTPFLDGRHTVFGKVIEGLDVIDSIALTPTESDRPIQDLYMTKVSIFRNGSAAKSFDAPAVMKKYFDDISNEEENRIANNAKWAAEAAAQKEQARFLPSGLGILTLQQGTGEKPKIGTDVQVYYAGYFEDGGLFDSNIEDVAKQFDKFNMQRKNAGGYDATPMECSKDAPLIAGFKEGLLEMEYGEKVRLFIPSNLAWGENGAGNIIPPNANVIFDIEILKED